MTRIVFSKVMWVGRFSIRVPRASGYVTATATNNASGDTSEFSLPKRVVLLQ